MSKVIIARKFQNEWLVEIKDTRYLKTRDEVLKLVRENGLKVCKSGVTVIFPKYRNDSDNKRIYAEWGE